MKCPDCGTFCILAVGMAPMWRVCGCGYDFGAEFDFALRLWDLVTDEEGGL